MMKDFLEEQIYGVSGVTRGLIVAAFIILIIGLLAYVFM